MMKKKRLILAALFVLSLVGISISGGAVTYVFFWTVLSIPVILYLYILFVIINLKIYQKPEGRNMISGRPSDFYITLQNETFFSFSSVSIKFYSSFSTISDILEDVEYELPPHSRIQKKTKILCRYRGDYEVGVKKITVRDFLGVFSVTFAIKEPLSVIVAPARLRLFERFVIGEMTDADNENRAYRSMPDIPVREYITGDDIRFADWKASARLNRLMIREMTGEERSGIAIVMDPRRYGKETEEYLPPENKATECVLGLALYYLEHGIPVSVYPGDRTGESCELSATKDYEHLYTKLTGFTFAEDRDLMQMIASTPGLSGYRMLIFVMQKWNEDAAGAIMQISNGGIPVLLYLIDDASGVRSDDLGGNVCLFTIGSGTAIGEVLS